jgi:hypothetical protein
VSAEIIEQALLDHYPAGSINAVSTARTALTEVDVVRGAVEQRFAESRAVCMNKFFMSQCVAEAKEIRRAALHSIRKVEVEANAFLRKDRAAERERTVDVDEHLFGLPLDVEGLVGCDHAGEIAHAVVLDGIAEFRTGRMTDDRGHG